MLMITVMIFGLYGEPAEKLVNPGELADRARPYHSTALMPMALGTYHELENLQLARRSITVYSSRRIGNVRGNVRGTVRSSRFRVGPSRRSFYRVRSMRPRGQFRFRLRR